MFSDERGSILSLDPLICRLASRELLTPLPGIINSSAEHFILFLTDCVDSVVVYLYIKSK